MKKYFNLLCGVIALLCFISLYMPLVAPRFPAADYIYTASAARDYALSGDYFWAREYWSVSRFLFSTGSPIPKVIISLTQVLLIFWAFEASKGEAGKVGVAVAVLNLIVVAASLIFMLKVAGGVRWEVLVMMALDCVAAVVLAVLHSRMKDPPKYISVNVKPQKG